MNLIYIILSTFGIRFNNRGKSLMDSAMSSFTKAQRDLNLAVEQEIECIKTFEEKQKEIIEEIKNHNKIKKTSVAYLNKINDFLEVDEDE